MNKIGDQPSWLATCPKGLEELLAEELLELGAEQVKQTIAAVHFKGPLTLAYRVCLWSRLASRLLLPLAQIKLQSADDLYSHCMEIAWEDHFSSANSIRVDFVGTSRLIDHTTFGAQRVKDAIVDRLRNLEGERPSVDLKTPDIRIQARLHKGVVSVALDISGESLHHRGYRHEQSRGAIQENLAAALLLRSGWTQLARQGAALLDPMCGGAILLIEGAMLAADIAPGALRTAHRYGFFAWKQHNMEAWEKLQTEAQQRKQKGVEALTLDIRGYEANPRMVDMAMQNIQNAGLDEHIRIVHKSLQQFGKPTAEKGLLLTSLPYAEGFSEQENVKPLYAKLGQVLLKNFTTHWRVGVLTGNAELAREIDLSPTKQYQFYNGATPNKLLLFDDLRSKSALIEQRLQTTPPRQELSEGAQMLLNRLNKNQRRLSKWLKKSGVTCYRLYDADMPEYAVAVDLYGDALHVQEYAAPPSVPEAQARQRFTEVKQALKAYRPNAQIFFKERRKQKGSHQYHKLSSANSGVLIINEGPARLEVNLSDYLDTGLFLDHRPVRDMIRRMAKGKRFLNLFCYTAAASIHAALGGAEKTLSIDMSNTYLDWARRNFELNGLSEKQNPLMRADCLEWLKRGIGEFDLIFLDPPTFSNSKKMQAVLDVQRDHIELIRGAMQKLTGEGTLIFSNNFRKFKMDDVIADEFVVSNITGETLDPDFGRNPRIHHVWKITHRKDKRMKASDRAKNKARDGDASANQEKHHLGHERMAQRGKNNFWHKS
ncbi:MAG: bifunctional 23S rRNA (guanine(2069)-N(7))-methyltransferase RlmK/23S rRNA (guanine(2445)-N(2))-methyltransferase RlmL [Pseudomonadales bacterium]|nr:bifunctional 23S rRNA (guanine(2069)-N(7))-methyltransferase RlmK/23S rRNA (guanine(2445)-N(2))-methyltransferase RlmL [Pseudomonadales bacterium]